MKYYEALQTMTDGMKHLTLDEEQKIYDEIGIAANHLNHLPYAGLREKENLSFSGGKARSLH